MKTCTLALFVSLVLTACGGAHSTGPNVPKEEKKEQAETNLLETDAGSPDVGDRPGK